MFRTMLAIAAVAAGVTAVMAQSDPIGQRQQLMKQNGENFDSVNRMVRGRQRFDPAKVNSAFNSWEETAQKIPDLFGSPPPRGAKTDALPKIWQNKQDFDAKADAFAKAVADNWDQAKTLNGLKASFSNIEKACGDCHESYRRPPSRAGRRG
jgi:cytochrome c556